MHEMNVYLCACVRTCMRVYTSCMGVRMYRHDYKPACTLYLRVSIWTCQHENMNLCVRIQPFGTFRQSTDCHWFSASCSADNLVMKSLTCPVVFQLPRRRPPAPPCQPTSPSSPPPPPPSTSRRPSSPSPPPAASAPSAAATMTTACRRCRRWRGRSLWSLRNSSRRPSWMSVPTSLRHSYDVSTSQLTFV